MPPSQPKSITREQVVSLCLLGARLSAEEAQELERLVTHDPENVIARLQLIGFNRGASRSPHILFMISHHPQIQLGPNGVIALADDPESYAKGKSLWLNAIHNNAGDLAVVDNAALYFLFSEPDLGLACYEGIDSRSNVEWLSSEATYCDLWMGIAVEDAAAVVRVGRHCRRLLKLVFALEKDPQRKLLAIWALRQCALAMNDRQAGAIYRLAHDTMIHSISGDQAKARPDDVMIAAGLLMSADGEWPQAEMALVGASKILAAPTPPSMHLARELLSAGRRDAVVTFLVACSARFPSDRDAFKAWIEVIVSGETPPF
jgi:hypothetical protein